MTKYNFLMIIMLISYENMVHMVVLHIKLMAKVIWLYSFACMLPNGHQTPEGIR